MEKNEQHTQVFDRTLPELPQKYAKLEQRLAAQTKEIEKLTAICKELILENETLKAKLNPQDGLPDGYNTGWHWYKKITWALKTADRPLLSQELIAYLQQTDENFKYNTNPVGFLSAYLTNAVKRKLISRHKQPGTRGFYYCLPHWMNGDELELEYLKMLY
jgi:hypothetical protein